MRTIGFTCLAGPYGAILAALCRIRATAPRRFNHISFELSAEIGFSPASIPIGPQSWRGQNSPRVARMSFEANKIAGAILVAHDSRDGVGHPRQHAGAAARCSTRTPTQSPARRRAAESTGAPAAPAGPEPIAPLLAAASADAGKSDAKLCAACHTFDKGGPNRIGPNLYGVVGDEIAHDRGGFAFSAALKAKGKGRPGRPTSQRLAVQAAGLRQGHQDDLRRPAQGQGPRQRHRLSQFAERQPQAARAARRRRSCRRRAPPAAAAPRLPSPRQRPRRLPRAARRGK